MKKIGHTAVLLLLTGCAAAPLMTGAEHIKITNVDPGKECKFLGDATGNQGDFFYGAFTSGRR